MAIQKPTAKSGQLNYKRAKVRTPEVEDKPLCIGREYKWASAMETITYS
jgi:hypothetical protein